MVLAGEVAGGRSDGRDARPPLLGVGQRQGGGGDTNLKRCGHAAAYVGQRRGSGVRGVGFVLAELCRHRRDGDGCLVSDEHLDGDGGQCCWRIIANRARNNHFFLVRNDSRRQRVNRYRESRICGHSAHHGGARLILRGRRRMHGNCPGLVNEETERNHQRRAQGGDPPAAPSHGYPDTAGRGRCARCGVRWGRPADATRRAGEPMRRPRPRDQDLHQR